MQVDIAKVFQWLLCKNQIRQLLKQPWNTYTVYTHHIPFGECWLYMYSNDDSDSLVVGSTFDVRCWSKSRKASDNSISLMQMARGFEFRISLFSEKKILFSRGIIRTRKKTRQERVRYSGHSEDSWSDSGLIKFPDFLPKIRCLI